MNSRKVYLSLCRTYPAFHMVKW